MFGLKKSDKLVEGKCITLQSADLRQMEASLYTLKLPQEGQQSQIPLGVTREAEPTNK